MARRRRQQRRLQRWLAVLYFVLAAGCTIYAVAQEAWFFATFALFNTGVAAVLTRVRGPLRLFGPGNTQLEADVEVLSDEDSESGTTTQPQALERPPPPGQLPLPNTESDED